MALLRFSSSDQSAIPAVSWRTILSALGVSFVLLVVAVLLAERIRSASASVDPLDGPCFFDDQADSSFSGSEQKACPPSLYKAHQAQSTSSALVDSGAIEERSSAHRFQFSSRSDTGLSLERSKEEDLSVDSDVELKDDLRSNESGRAALEMSSGQAESSEKRSGDIRESDRVVNREPEQQEESSVAPSLPPSQEVPVETAPVVSPPARTPPDESTEPNADAQTAPVEITVSLVIRGPGAGTYEVTVSEGATVERVMRTATSKGFVFVTESSPSLGAFVVSINGQEQDEQAGAFWSYKYNGTFASRGISSQRVQEGDVIEWVYGASF